MAGSEAESSANQRGVLGGDDLGPPAHSRGELGKPGVKQEEFFLADGQRLSDFSVNEKSNRVDSADPSNFDFTVLDQHQMDLAIHLAERRHRAFLHVTPGLGRAGVCCQRLRRKLSDLLAIKRAKIANFPR